MDRRVDNLSLIGFMGVGKSTMGRHLARELGYRFMDTDALIQERQGRSIAEIFQDEGEASFRVMEAELAGEFAGWSRTVIATGGGLVIPPLNLGRLQEASYVVCLWASAETIHRRVANSRRRPLLQQDNPMETIRQKLEERAGIYRQADLLIHTGSRPLSDLVSQVLRHYRRALAGAESAKGA